MKEPPTQQLPESDESGDRSKGLQDMLKYGLSEDDLLTAVRELARLTIHIYKVIQSLPTLQSTMASTQRMVIEYMADQLKERRERESRELEVAMLTAEKARLKLDDTNEKIKTIQFPIKTDVPEPVPQSQADKTWTWFRDRVLPYFMTAALIIIAQAVWEYIKVQSNIP